MDKVISGNQEFPGFLRLLQFLLLIYGMPIHEVLSNFLLFFQTSLLAPLFLIPKIWKIRPPRTSNMKTNSIGDENCYCKLSQEEMKVVMDRLGRSYQLDSDNLEDGFGAEELAAMFDEEEPSLGEVKEAFDVFDENKDGFIDATELQRVLRCLGMEGRFAQLEECARMIKVADEDGDGRIDFNEFLKFMETCFC